MKKGKYRVIENSQGFFIQRAYYYNDLAWRFPFIKRVEYWDWVSSTAFASKQMWVDGESLNGCRTLDEAKKQIELWRKEDIIHVID